MEKHKDGLGWPPVVTKLCYFYIFLHKTKLYFNFINKNFCGYLKQSFKSYIKNCDKYRIFDSENINPIPARLF